MYHHTLQLTNFYNFLAFFKTVKHKSRDCRCVSSICKPGCWLELRIFPEGHVIYQLHQFFRGSPMSSSKLCTGTQILHVLHAVHAGFPASTSKFPLKDSPPPHLTQFLHNATLEIGNWKFSPNDQLHSCAAYSNSPFLPSSLLSCLSSLETFVYQRQQRAQPGNLNSSYFRFVNAYRKMDGQNDFIGLVAGNKGTQITRKYRRLPLR